MSREAGGIQVGGAERARARALGERSGYGRLVKLASPSYEAEAGFVVPLGVVLIVGGIAELFKRPHREWLYIAGPITIAMGLALVILFSLAKVQRRPGGSAPRLYCFTGGVVVAVRSQLVGYRWDELGIESVWWEDGVADFNYSGYRRTVTVNATGAVLVEFSGREPERAGAYQMEQLHEKALKLAAETPADSPSIPPHE